MKTVVIYDSVYGNTEQIAQAIAGGLSAGSEAAEEVEAHRVGDVQPDQLATWDLLVIGAPTHGSHPSPAMHDFLESIPPGALTGVQVAAFDTRTDVNKLTGVTRLFGRLLDRWGYAAPRISASLEERGGHVVAPPEGFIVKDKEGPLEEGELERAEDWGGQTLARARSLR